MYWANFLHIYQPPTQTPYWVKRVAKESYVPLIEGLAKHKKGKITLNINAILVELLVANGYQGLVEKMGELAKNGQIEFTQSAKYHPLLPKIPKEEVVRQVGLNDETNRKHFGDAWQPKGFFPPEMAFTKDVAAIIKELGYDWVVVDELSFPGSSKSIDWSTIYTVDGLDDFKIFFRDRHVSFKILSAQLGTGAMLLRELGERAKSDTYLTTAMDGETFGHHRPGLELLLFDMWKSDELKHITMSELADHFSKREAIEPRPSTWALQHHEVELNIPFARWDDPKNEIHQMQWELTDLLLKQLKAMPKNAKGYEQARQLADEALHSDQYWWASAKPWWSLEYIERGAKDHVDALKAMPDIAEDVLQKADDLYMRILKTGFEWQRSGKVQEMAAAEDEEIRQRVDADRPFMSDEDFEEMVGTLQRQMDGAAEAREFERAAQFRDRIRELKEERAHFTGKDGEKKHTIEDDWGF